MDKKNIHTPTRKYRVHTRDAATIGAMMITMNTKAFFSGGRAMANALCALPCHRATAKGMATRTAIAILFTTPSPDVDAAFDRCRNERRRTLPIIELLAYL